MTQNQKIILGVGAIALAYWLYSKRGGGASGQTQSTPQNVGDSPKVYYCKDGFKVTMEKENPNIQNIRYANPCEGHGGIDEIKTNGGGDPLEPSSIPNTLSEDEKRKICEKRIDNALKSGNAMSAMPREGLIRGCMNTVSSQNTITDDYTYEVLENITVEYFSSTTGNYKIATFKKGQIINAKPIPMGNVGGLATTPDGKYPNMGLVGNAIVTLPVNKLKRLK